MQILRIFSVLFIVAGFIMVLAAKWIVSKYGLDKNTACDFEFEMSEEELRQYKYNKAVANFKILGMAVALPGFILFFVAFR